jgi:quinol monooxygenase YgiN
MKHLLGLFFRAVLAVASSAVPIRAADVTPPNQGPVYVTTFFEVTPGAAIDTAVYLKLYRNAARKEPGVLSADVYQEAGWPSRFITFDVWNDWSSYGEHTKNVAIVELFRKLRPYQFGPPDVRTHLMHFDALDTVTPGPNSVIILSHLDVTPNVLPKLIEIMKPLSEGTLKDRGMQKFQIIRQAPGTGNHFRLFEIWTSACDWNAHNFAAHTEEFRTELAPILGTPYDQRRYQVLD